MKNKKSNKDLKYFKIILKYLKDDKLYIILYIIFSILFSILPIVVSIFWGNAIDNLTQLNKSSFIIYLLIWLISWILTWCICGLICNLIYNKLEKDFVKNGRIELYNKVLNLPTIAFEDMGVGELTNRLNNDLENIISLLTKIIDFSSKIIMAIIVFIYSFTVSIYIGLEFTVLGVVMFLLANVYYPKIKKIQEEISKDVDNFIRMLLKILVV